VSRLSANTEERRNPHHLMTSSESAVYLTPLSDRASARETCPCMCVCVSRVFQFRCVRDTIVIVHVLLETFVLLCSYPSAVMPVTTSSAKLSQGRIRAGRSQHRTCSPWTASQPCCYQWQRRCPGKRRGTLLLRRVAFSTCALLLRLGCGRWVLDQRRRGLGFCVRSRKRCVGRLASSPS
jgi:hypothetical protein